MEIWLVKELVKMEQAGVNIHGDTAEQVHEYEEQRKTLEELLKSPMTLAQGAAIMNALRKDEEAEEDA